MQIDWWTLALQTVNVLVLIWILSRFLFRPIARIIEARQAEIAASTERAEAERQAAASERAKIEQERAALASERVRLADEARADGQKELETLKAQASQEIDNERAALRAGITRERKEAEAGLFATASTLSLDIAQRLLGRVSGDMAMSIFLEGLNDKLRAHSDALHSTDTFELVSAQVLTPVQQTEARALLSNTLGANAALSFRSDPALIAGVALLGPHLRVDNNWRADLDAIGRELAAGN